MTYSMACIADHPSWTNALPTSLISVTGVSIAFITTNTTMLSSVPMNVKSLCGGMINTAFQIGSGVALAISSAITQSVDVNKDHSQTQQYQTGLWCTAGLAGVGLLFSFVGVRHKGCNPSEGTKEDPTTLE